MDKYNRITKWQEWETGKIYQWLKGGVTGELVYCVSLSLHQDGNRSVQLRWLSTNCVVDHFRSAETWKNRYVKVL